MKSKNALTHLIRAGRDALNLENVLNQFGYKETPYFNLYGEIAEAIYCLLDENTESFEQSVAHAVMHDPLTSDEAAADELAKLLDKASNSGIEIPETTMEVINEAAEDRGFDSETMIRIILAEWAMKETFSQNVF